MRFALVLTLCACSEKYDAERTARIIETKVAEKDGLQLTVTCSGAPLSSDGDRMACGAKDRDGRYSPVEAYVKGSEIWYRIEKAVNLEALAGEVAQTGTTITCDRKVVMLGNDEYYACPAVTGGKPTRFRLGSDAKWQVEPDYKTFIEEQLAAQGFHATATCPPPAGVAKGDRVACDIVESGTHHIVDIVRTKDGVEVEPR